MCVHKHTHFTVRRGRSGKRNNKNWDSSKGRVPRKSFRVPQFYEPCTGTCSGEDIYRRGSKFRLQQSKMGRCCSHLFCFLRDVMHTEFVREGETANSDFCLPVHKWLCERISELGRQFGEKGIWFVFHNNAPAHFVVILKHFLANRGTVQVTTHLNHQTSRQLPFITLYPENDPPRKQISRQR